MSKAAVFAWIVALAPMVAVAQQGKEQATALDVKGRGLKTFYANSRVGNNTVTVFSESALEDFTGVCNRVGGQCRFDPQNVASLRGRFFIRVQHIDTALELRNQHLRKPEWLDAANHPEISVEITGVEDVKKVADDSAKLTLLIKCTIRGKTNDERVPATLKYLDETPETMRRVGGDLVRIRAKWKTKLSDYGVHGPPGSDALGLKVSDEIEIRVTVFGSTERPPDALKADDGADVASRAAPRRPPPKRDDK